MDENRKKRIRRWWRAPDCTKEQARRAYELFVAGHSAPLIAMEIGLPLATIYRLRAGRIPAFYFLYRRVANLIPRRVSVYLARSNGSRSDAPPVSPQELSAVLERYPNLGLGLPLPLPRPELYRALQREKDEREAQRLAFESEPRSGMPPGKRPGTPLRSRARSLNLSSTRGRSARFTGSAGKGKRSGKSPPATASANTAPTAF